MNTEEYLLLYPFSDLYSDEHRKNLSRDTRGSKNPMFGKVHSKITKMKMSDFRSGNLELNKKVSLTRKRMFASGELKSPFLGKKHSPETIKILSEKAIYRLNESFNIYANHQKGYFFSHKNNCNIWYDSSYELKAFEILEKDGRVLKFERNKIKVPYIFEGFQKYCLPDLLVTYTNGTEKIIEIKPERKIKLISKEGVKIDFMSSYFEHTKRSFGVWTEKELGLEDK